MLQPKRLFPSCLCLLLAMAGVNGKVTAQQDTASSHHRHLFSVGVGPSYYFNNLVTGRSLVNEWSYDVTVRWLWTPGYFFNLGIESGYYRLYSVKANGTAKVNIVNVSVPIHMAVGMHLTKELYVDLSLGPSLLYNNVHSDTYGNFNASSFSLADFSGGLEYRFHTRGRFDFAVGPKFFYSSHLDDKTLALIFSAGYKL